MNSMRALILEDSNEDVVLLVRELRNQGYNFDHQRI